MNKPKLILGACLGECVHVAGILSFLKIAEEKGYNGLAGAFERKPTVSSCF